MISKTTNLVAIASRILFNPPRSCPEAVKCSNIARLNDEAREFPGITCRLYLADGISKLDLLTKLRIIRRVSDYTEFSEDSYQERNSGAFGFKGITVIWKIDYYSAKYTEFVSDDPSCNALTDRLLTIMRASENYPL